jgi:hypothetical protein
MSGRNSPFYGKRRSKTKAPGKKPNAHRLRHLAKRKKQYRESGLFALREAKRLEEAEPVGTATATAVKE